MKTTTAQVVETSVTGNNNSPIQDYVHPDDQTQPFEMIPGFKPFTRAKFARFGLLWFNFILGLYRFLFLCFQTHYHTLVITIPQNKRK